MTTGSTGIRSLAASADAVLMKPFGVRELLAVLKKVGVGEPSRAAADLRRAVRPAARRP
jgi:DNA-binding response OmpR family regulator